MLSEEQINYHANGCCTSGECNIGRKALADEIKRLRAELAEAHETVTTWMKDLGEAERDRDELKRKLEVYESGMPNGIDIKYVSGLAEDFCDPNGETHEIIKPTLNWLRLIAEIAK